MNKAQTPSAAILADFVDPRLTELDLCERHALTLDALLAITQSPHFRHALATLRAVREARAPALLERARLTAARVLAAISDHTPANTSEAREIRLALKDLLQLINPTQNHRQKPTQDHSQDPPNPQHPPQEPPIPYEDPDLTTTLHTLPETPQSPPPSGQSQVASPSSPASPLPPKRPRGTKPKPKPRSR